MNTSKPSGDTDRRAPWLRAGGFVLVAVVSGWTAAIAVQCGLQPVASDAALERPDLDRPAADEAASRTASGRADARLDHERGPGTDDQDPQDPELEPEAAFALEAPSSWGLRVQQDIGEALPRYLSQHTRTSLESVECRESTCLMQLRVSEGAEMREEVMATLRWAMVVGVDHCGYGTRRDPDDEWRMTAYLHCPSQGVPQMDNVRHLVHEEAL